jgi:hypothetical protein
MIQKPLNSLIYLRKRIDSDLSIDEGILFQQNDLHSSSALTKQAVILDLESNLGLRMNILKGLTNFASVKDDSF